MSSCKDEAIMVPISKLVEHQKTQLTDIKNYYNSVKFHYIIMDLFNSIQTLRCWAATGKPQ